MLRESLPLPALRSGYLWAADPVGGDSSGGWQQVDERWRRRWFVLDSDSLRSISGPQQHLPGAHLQYFSRLYVTAVLERDQGATYKQLAELADAWRPGLNDTKFILMRYLFRIPSLVASVAIPQERSH